jgi:hypothetical protein
MLALFNYIFLTEHYKTGYNIGAPFVKSSIMITVYIIVAEILLRVIPYMRNYCDSVGIQNQVKQIPVLAAGIVLYIAINVLAYKKAVSNFNKVDL